MNFWKRLSGRSRQALRVFFMASLIALAFSQTNLYRLAELRLFDQRLAVWLGERNREAPLKKSPFNLYQYRDSTRAQGITDVDIVEALHVMSQAGAKRIYILNESVFQDFGAARRRFPDNVVVLNADSRVGTEVDRERLFHSSEALQLESLMDLDGNLRKLPWDHPAVEFAQDIAEASGMKRLEHAGPNFMLKPLSSEFAGIDANGSPIENVITEIRELSKTGIDNPLRFLKDRVVFLERATVEASTFAQVSTPVRTLTAGQIYSRLFRSIADEWTVTPISFSTGLLLYLLIVGGTCLVVSGRHPLQVGLVGLLSLGGTAFASSFLLPRGVDAPVVLVVFAQFAAILLMVYAEMRRGRRFLKSFGGAEDAAFEGEESEATMVFTNLPPFLMEMEREHHENLLKYRRDYNEVLALVARRYHGKVLDYQGDAQMLGFGLRYDGDSEHAAEATSAAMEIVEQVSGLAERWGVPPEKLKVHAGVCTGSIALGHLGAVQKQDIAAIGDTTNTAARLMGAAMKQSVPVLISKPTYLLADGVIRGEEREPVELKGKSAPVEVFLPLQVTSEWQQENRAKNKEATPSGGTLVYKGQRQSGLVLTVVSGLVGVLLIQQFWSDGVLDQAERTLVDVLHRSVGFVEADPRIVILGIDETSLANHKLGRFPWSRGVYGQAIRNLEKAGHRALFFDIMFKRARAGDPEGDRYLAEALHDDPRTVLAGVLFRDENFRLSRPALFPAVDYKLLQKRYQIGLIHEAAGLDDVARHGYLSAQETASHGSQEEDSRELFPSAAAAMLLREGDRFEVGEGEVFLGDLAVSASVLDQGKSTLAIRFGPSATADGLPPQENSYRMVSFGRLLDPEDPIFEELQGKYLLVGQTLTSGEQNDVDRIDTVAGRLKGVEVHARILDNLLNQNYLREASERTNQALIWLVACTAIAILARYRDAKSYLSRLFLLLLGATLNYLLLFSAFGFITRIVILWMTVGVVSACVLVVRYLLTYQALTMVVPKEVADELLFHHEARDRRLTATILLTDIRGYTTLSEGRTAVAMLDVLNEYHKRTVACYDKYGGQALTYQGDAQIVVFGVFGNRENPAADAVAAALGLQAICDELRAEWGIESREDFDVGAGLCTGEVEVGLLGSGNNLQYSVVGETVRKAHKVQSLSADLEAPVILDEETFQATDGAVKVDDLGLVQPKGLPTEIRLYRARSVGE